MYVGTNMGGLINVNAWKTKVASEKARIKSKATAYVQKKAYEVLLTAVKISPQFSGNFASNWVIVTTDNPARFYSYPQFIKDKTSPRSEGDMSGMEQNLSFNRELISRVKWNSNIKLENVTPKDEGGLLLDDMQQANEKFRPVNMVAREIGVMAYLKHTYRFVS